LCWCCINHCCESVDGLGVGVKLETH
jgi:hypothetical protein